MVLLELPLLGEVRVAESLVTTGVDEPRPLVHMNELVVELAQPPVGVGLDLAVGVSSVPRFGHTGILSVCLDSGQ
jgi:hypothetical protein